MVGTGGIGKTVMAVEYAFQHQGDYPGGVYWLESEQGLSQAIVELLMAWGTEPPEGIGVKELLKLVAQRLNAMPLKLVVLDNLEDPSIPAGLGLKDVHLLVTTRLKTVPLTKIDMELPEEEAAEDIFLAYAGLAKGDLNEKEKQALDLMVEQAGRLPLALEVMGSLVGSSGLIGAGRKTEGLLQIKASVQAKGGQELSVAAVLNLANQTFKNRQTKKVLIAAGYLASEDISLGLISQALKIKKPKAELALAELAGLSRLKPNRQGGYTCHRLIQEAARGLDKKHKVGKQLVRVLQGLANGIIESGQYLQGYPLLPHIIHIAAMAEEEAALEAFPAEAAIYRWAWLLNDCGLSAESVRLYRCCLARIEKSKSEENERYTARLNNLAGVLEAQGKYEQAEKLYGQALEIDKVALGDDHPGYATDLNNLAGLLANQGRFKEALPMQEQAVEICLARRGPEHPYTKDSIAGLENMKREAAKK